MGGAFEWLGGAPRKPRSCDSTTRRGRRSAWTPGFAPGDSSVWKLALSPDGETLYANGGFAAGSDRGLAALRTSDGQSRSWGWRFGGDVATFAFTPAATSW